MGAITAELVDVGEKRDTRGRRVLPAVERRRMIERYRDSGLTMAQYARREGINYSTLAAWLHRERPKDPTASRGEIAFAQVQLPAALPRGIEKGSGGIEKGSGRVL